MIHIDLWKGLSRQKSLELSFEFRQCGEIRQIERQRIPDSWSNKTETALTKSGLLSGRGCSSVGRTSDRHAADAASIPRYGEGFFSQSQLSVQTLLRVSAHPVCNRMHWHLRALYRSCSPCQSSVKYGNTETRSMHRGLSSATLLQLAFPGEATQISHSKKIPMGHCSGRKKRKKRR